MESFWALLKRELEHIYGIKRWPTTNALRSAIFEYIEAFHNHSRSQATLGYLSPGDYEGRLLSA